MLKDNEALLESNMEGGLLRVPRKELELAEKNGYEHDIALLEKKYAAIHELSRGRSIADENKRRNMIRAERGKKTLPIEEEYRPSLRTTEVGGKRVCFAPWKEKGVLEGKYSGCLECCPMIELDGDPIYGC